MRLTLFAILIFVGLSIILSNQLPIRYNAIPIVYNDGLPYIKLSINGKGAVFMLDTGCNTSIIDASESKQYDFTLADVLGIMNGINGSITTYYADNYHVVFGEYTLSDGFVAMNMSNGFFDEVVSGVIGSDILVRYKAKVDLKDKILYIPK